jgi:hypothetical protein
MYFTLVPAVYQPNLLALSGGLFTLAIVEQSHIRFGVVPNGAAVFKTKPSPFKVIFICVNSDTFTGSKDLRWESE